MKLTHIELRVVGVLAEKELTTPDNYPLSLNSLRLGCNQKSNREPVMNLNDDEVKQALSDLKDKKLAIFSDGQQQRVTKYKHCLETVFKLGRRELALITVLILRGKQTAGELKLRTQRMYSFKSIEEVQNTLQNTMNGDDKLVMLLPRESGRKEQRYMHLLGEESMESETNDDEQEIENQTDKLMILERQIVELREEFNDLKDKFIRFKNELEN